MIAEPRAPHHAAESNSRDGRGAERRERGHSDGHSREDGDGGGGRASGAAHSDCTRVPLTAASLGGVLQHSHATRA
jgi:hypothetical protein